jgi:DNA-binding response OmpR family regulator
VIEQVVGLREKLQAVPFGRIVEAAHRAARVPSVAADDSDLRRLHGTWLRHFVEHRGASLSRDELLADVWGYDATPLTRTVDVHVAGLRQKIERNPKSPEFIVAVHGLGYKFLG